MVEKNQSTEKGSCNCNCCDWKAGDLAAFLRHLATFFETKK